MIELKYITALILSMAFVYLLIKNAVKIGILDTPRDRSVHSEVVPSSGGIGFIFAIFITFILFDTQLFLQYIYMFIAIFLIYLIGMYDDFNDVRPRIKFLAIFVASVILYFNNIYIDSLGSYFGFEMPLGLLALPFTIFAIAGFTNALNLIDGLDGLASGVSLIILATFAYVGMVFNDDFILLLSLMTSFALLGFMIFNWNPSKIFMGDSGSLTLGFIISIIAILSLKYIHPVVILYFTAIPLIDTLVVMIRRIKMRKSPFQADKTHIHHILFKFFGTTKKTVVFLMMTQTIFCFLGYVVARHIELYPKGLFPFAMIVSFIILTTMAYMVFTQILKNEGNR